MTSALMHLLGLALTASWAAQEPPRRAAAQARPARPNIVLILADDLGYRDIASFGCPDIPTPNIDSIGRNGVRFTDGYVTAAVCSPSRAGLLTGRYQQRFGHEFNPVQPASADGLPLALPLGHTLVAESLRREGYATGMVGKWHLGEGPAYRPWERGFDEFFGFLSGAHTYLDPAAADAKVASIPGEPQGSHDRTANPIQRNAAVIQEKEYLTDAFGREAADFVTRHRERPFFLYLAFNAVHTPFQTMRRYYDRFPGIANERYRVFAAMTSAMDDAVGKVLARLRETGLEKNTLVLFLSDNGCPLYVDVCSNQPLLGGKRTLYEGGIRVPFALQWPARIKAGRVMREPASALDLYPTFLAAAGTRPAPDASLDGIDLLPFLSDPSRPLPERALFWRMGPNAAVRKGRWKLLDAAGTIRLYDLKSDAAEQHDRSSEEPGVVADLRRELARWLARLKPPLWPARVVPMKLNADRIEWHI